MNLIKTILTINLIILFSFNINSMLYSGSPQPVVSVNFTSPFISTFNDLIVSGRDDTTSVQFQYSDAPIDVTVTTIATGTVNNSGSMAIINSGVATNGYANMSTNNRLRYRPGHEGACFFTAMWPNGSATGSTQWAGLFDSGDGAAIGYKDNNFSILFRQGGVDTVITQTNFNLDTINGSGPSGFNINPLFMNVFRIAYGWLGAAPIKYYVLSQTGQWINFHTINWPNSTTGPSFINPVLPIAFEVKKTSGASNLQINTSSLNAGIVGEPNDAGSRYFSAVNYTNLPASGNETHILTVQNKSSYNGYTNRVQVRIAAVSGGIASTPSEAGILRVRTNATVTGTSLQDVDSLNSVMQYSTAGTYVAGTGSIVFIYPGTSFGSNQVVFFLPETDLTITLNPGQSATITGASLSGAVNPFFGALMWEEQF